jgi:hypothetical protein
MRGMRPSGEIIVIIIIIIIIMIINAVRLPISCSLALDLDGPAAKDTGDEAVR